MKTLCRAYNWTSGDVDLKALSEADNRNNHQRKGNDIKRE